MEGVVEGEGEVKVDVEGEGGFGRRVWRWVRMGKGMGTSSWRVGGREGRGDWAIEIEIWGDGLGLGLFRAVVARET